MAEKIVWLPAAVADLEAICHYISLSSPDYAAIVAQAVLDAADDLLRFPHMGPRVPEWDRNDLRQRLVYNYRLIYRIVGQRIEILSIIHGARILPDSYQDRR
jgi:plasmid stabilization system protein ParE